MLMKMRSKMQNQKGFTLVELMVVVVILGILVAIAVPVYNAVTDKAKISAIEANLRTIDGAVMMYQANTDGVALTAIDVTAAQATVAADNILWPEYIKEWPNSPGSYIVTDGVAQVITTEKIGKADASTYTLSEFVAAQK